MIWHFSVILLCLLNCDCLTINSSAVQNRLLVVSFDAFREEYLHRGITPHLNALKMKGTYAPNIRNVFPTKTFVNHHSIATGMYPETHGVLANSLFDKHKGRVKYSYELFHYNEDIVPIWTLNEKEGHHSGCMMWPGSNFKYQGIECSHVQNYSIKMPLEERIDVALGWFNDPKKPANFVLMYIEEPDFLAHIYGPESTVVNNTVAVLDNITNYMQQKLVALGLHDSVNLIHLSDHGMVGVEPRNFLDFTVFLSNGTYSIYGTSPVLQIVPISGMETEVYKNMTRAASVLGHFKVYNKDNLPQRWRCENSDRMGPIIAVADLYYAFQDMNDLVAYYKKTYNITGDDKSQYGVHGYDNDLDEMRPIFIADGPLFKKHHVMEKFETVDLYSLFCYILNLTSSSTNGTFGNVSDLLVDSVTTASLALMAVLLCLSVVFVIAVISYCLISEREWPFCHRKKYESPVAEY